MKFILRPPLGPDNGRRFRPGMSGTLDGIRFRTVAGSKAPGDLVLEWETSVGWQRIRMHTVGLIIDFLYENEHVLYPPNSGYLGGEKLMEHIDRAVMRGWKAAADHLDAEKAAAQERRAS